MSREKANYRDVVAGLFERSGGKMVFNCRAIMRVLGIGHNKAAAYLAVRRRSRSTSLRESLSNRRISKNDYMEGNVYRG